MMGFFAILFIFHIQILKAQTEQMQRFAQVVFNSAYNQQSGDFNMQLLKKEGFELVTDTNLKQQIRTALQLPPERRHMRRHNNNLRLRAIEYKRDFYIALRGGMFFKAPHEKNMLPLVLLPTIAVLLLLFLYIAIIRSILPIYGLRQKVKEFADGNYDIDCKSNKKDEIAILSNEFDKSVNKIKKLRDSRQLFLRNIMHELKTPITKGKLSCEMIEESNYQTTLKNVFRRQEALLEEFSRIEKLSANELNINTQEYALEDVVDFSLDILTHDKSNVICKLIPMTINVDFELFGTAIKNLLDNGINYSDDLQVTIESTPNQIIISNHGDELEFPLQKYAEPYFLDGKKQRSSRGLGFGLFITLHVIRLHNMKIEYNRENQRNIFTIHVKKIRKK